MMLLVFKVNGDRYGINVRDVAEVIPKIPLRRLPAAPATLAGLLNYRGTIVPVIDSARLLSDKDVRECLSSRIIMVRSEKMKAACVGLLAEGVTETLKIDDSRFVDAEMGEAGGSLVDKVVLDNGSMIHHLNPDLLVPAEFRAFMTDGGSAAETAAEEPQDVS